jgi:hypothetical protein
MCGDHEAAMAAHHRLGSAAGTQGYISDKGLLPGHLSQGAPAEVDFDSLWVLAYQPALESLGYLPVRADSDAGSVIIKDMLERLAFADLVLADMTIPNGNVYYEVGIRHVAKESNCVLISADWSQQLFDVQQMCSLRFPLKDSSITAATAGAAVDAAAPRQPGDQGHRLRAAVVGARQPQLGGHPDLHRAAAGLGEGQSLQPRAGPAGPSQGR